MKIKHPLNVLDYIIEFSSLLSVLCTIVLFVIFWNNAPQIVPIHYNIYGVADRFGSKTILIILPIISSMTYIGLTVLNKFPQVFNFPAKVTEENKVILYKIATRMIRWIKLFICLLFADIVRQGAKMTYNQEYRLGSVSLFIFIACIMFCLIFYIAKMIRISK